MSSEPPESEQEELKSQPIVKSEESPEVDPDDTPIEEVKASIRRALQEAKSGQRIPISQMRESIDLQP
jgi:hypothetical protein